ncbi:uncharacterized protein VTP21DRAFT_54 [Calcarisporiella thermophila]|uniref:uncharacterized protein n=1 Tax=Calcarisporiella thermophila TaxID=911321 RepID=UPI0037445FC2
MDSYLAAPHSQPDPPVSIKRAGPTVFCEDGPLHQPAMPSILTEYPPQPTLSHRFRYSSSAKFEAHRPYSCDKCNHSFHRSHDLKRHLRIHEKIKPFECTHCHRTFSRRDALKRHLTVRKCGLRDLPAK